MLNALPLRYMCAILLNVQEKMSALSAFTPPPDYYTKGNVFVCVCGGRRCRQAARECNGVWLGRMPARQALYYTLVMVCGRASHRGASQNGGEFLATSGALHWDAQPATLDNPKSGMHPSHRVHPRLLGKRCLNQDFRDLWIDRMPGDGPIPIRWVSSRRLKRHTAVAK